MAEMDKALKEMVSEKLIEEKGEYIQLTPQGQKLGKEWESLLLKKEPIMEVVAGLSRRFRNKPCRYPLRVHRHA